MSYSLLKSETPKNTEALKYQLKQFGLNPEEWEVSPSNGNQFLILNQSDSNFQFFGKASDDSKSLKWQSIQLYKI